MKIRPILFSSPMVQAILDVRKTQTRRIIDKDDRTLHDPRTTSVDLTDNNGMAHFRWKEQSTHYCGMPSKYKVGDIMWVRETWKPGAWRDLEYKAAFDYKASPELKNTPWCHFEDMQKFDDLHVKWIDELYGGGIEPSWVAKNKGRFGFHWEPGKSPFSWKPSIHMPKEACRLFLKVTNVRVERLKDISMEDAVAEGIQPITAHNDPNRILGWHDYMVNPKDGFNTFFDPRESLFSLWESINGNESLDANPWVWVYDFEVIERPPDFLKSD